MTVGATVVLVVVHRKLLGHCSNVIFKTAFWTRGIVEAVAPGVVVVAAFIFEDKIQAGLGPNCAESVIRSPTVRKGACHDVVLVWDFGQVEMFFLLLWALGEVDLHSCSLGVRLVLLELGQ